MSATMTKFKPVGARRLLALAGFLEELPSKRFDYGSWVGIDWKGKPDLSCGTTACAMGWATTMPMFRRLGLRLRLQGLEGSLFIPELSGTDDGDRGDVLGSRLFGISWNEYDYLFMPCCTLLDDNGWPVKGSCVSPDRGATPKQVAKHIRRFVAWKKAQVMSADDEGPMTPEKARARYGAFALPCWPWFNSNAFYGKRAGAACLTPSVAERQSFRRREHSKGGCEGKKDRDR